MSIGRLPMSPPISSLFDEQPVQWGLRGDPGLWREMRERFAEAPMPTTVDDLVSAIGKMFEELTGHPLSHPQWIYVERYAGHGMSRGLVTPEFWREQAIPLLKRRFEET